eukprot:scaffold49256_cov489-Isochrysis_galbana.AAC.2
MGPQPHRTSAMRHTGVLFKSTRDLKPTRPDVHVASDGPARLAKHEWLQEECALQSRAPPPGALK